MRQVTRLIRYVAPYWWQFASSVLLLAGVGFFEAFRLLLVGPVLDRVLNPSSGSDHIRLFTIPGSNHAVYLEKFVPTHFHNAWTIVAYALVASTVLKGIFDYAGTYLVNHAGFGMITDLRNDLYESILRRSAAFFQRHTTGTLVSTIVNDIERVQYAMSSVLAEFLQQFFTLIFTAGAVVLLGGKLAWMLLLFVPVIVYSAGKIGRRVRHTTRRGQDKLAHGVLTPGAFVAFIAAVFSLYNPVRKFALFNNNFQQALGASSELFKFMDSEDEVREKPGAKPLPTFSSSIRFDDVSFSYEGNGDGAREILRNINLKVKAGEVLAVVGSSGAGKSTLVHLIPRFFDVTSGALLIDGRDVRDTTLASLRSLIGVVTQETVLFNDTVRNNIAYGRPSVPQKQVEAAARAALAHDFIMDLPAGYDTVIGERGVRLSGGERQRIAIARALLKNAPILILDEATSALDSESESLVQSALQNLMTGRTVFVIAHRLSTVRRADRIVVLENGTITDIGAHEELMQKLGTYRRLYDLQFVELDQPKVGASQ